MKIAQAQSAPLRILMLARSLPMHAVGGMEAAAWDLARALARRGCKVEILTTAYGDATDQVREGVVIRFLDAPPARYSSAWRRESVRVGLAAAESCDVVLSVSAAGFDLARILRRKRQRPVLVMQAHGTSWLELTSKLAARNPIAWLKAVRNARGLALDLAYRNFDTVISIGPAVTEDMRRFPTRAIMGSTPVHEISNGVDETFFAFSAESRKRVRAAMGIPAEAPTVITTARLNAEKGVAQSLAAFAEFIRLEPQAHYIVAGDGPARAELEGQAKAAGLSNAVHFVGALAREAVAQHLSAADVFLFTTLRREGLPLNVLEAFASGLPAALSEHIVAPHFPAAGVSPHAARDIAATLDSLIHGASGERRSSLPDQHSLAHVGEAYEAAFSVLVDQKPTEPVTAP